MLKQNLSDIEVYRLLLNKSDNQKGRFGCHSQVLTGRFKNKRWQKFGNVSHRVLNFFEFPVSANLEFKTSSQNAVFASKYSEYF